MDQYSKHLHCSEKLKLSWKVSLTLWGETAKRFDGSNQPVIAVKATRVRSFVLLLLDLGENFFCHRSVPLVDAL